MKKAIIAVTLFFLLCLPAFAADEEMGRFGVDVGWMFFDNPALDNSSWFAGLEFAGDMWSIELDYTAPDAVPLGEQAGGTEQLMLLHADFVWYFNEEEYDTETPTYIGVGYSHRFQGDAVDDGGGFNVILGMDWDENWNFEAKYVRFDDDDSLWAIGAAYFFDFGE
jgi:hypothetical protein